MFIEYFKFNNFHSKNAGKFHTQKNSKDTDWSNPELNM